MIAGRPRCAPGGPPAGVVPANAGDQATWPSFRSGHGRTAPPRYDAVRSGPGLKPPHASARGPAGSRGFRRGHRTGVPLWRQSGTRPSPRPPHVGGADPRATDNFSRTFSRTFLRPPSPVPLSQCDLQGPAVAAPSRSPHPKFARISTKIEYMFGASGVIMPETPYISNWRSSQGCQP